VADKKTSKKKTERRSPNPDPAFSEHRKKGKKRRPPEWSAEKNGRSVPPKRKRGVYCGADHRVPMPLKKGRKSGNTPPEERGHGPVSH